MVGQIIAVAVALLGVDAGWQRRTDDGLDYLIQIQPPLVRALEDGQTVESEIPPQLRGKVYAYKITVGTKKIEQNPTLDELSRGSALSAPSLPGMGAAAPPGPPMPQVTAAKPVPSTGTATVASGTASGLMSPAPDSQSPTRLWTYLIVALVALAGSVSWNVYLLWLLKEARRRYRALLQRSGLTQDELEQDDEAEEEEVEEEDE